MNNDVELPFTWRELATIQPEVVQAIVQATGPLPDDLADSPVKQSDYERLVAQAQAEGGR